ncbi:heavy metal-binding domain-containing protein [Aliihoeflea sp. 40Bstr573]|uniref:heavy metal-binding domain-containing protein n=1 Tax=Aliihoeflea sp. 40Bstr573 TaxID=2696467 RepID=UPI0020943EB5|nr:heavy metal-binding domain-containing protein [Aliihoeflea sp. 40Bstr573]
MTIAGAREGAMYGIRRAVAAAMARDLTAFVLPGPSVARSMGIDLANAHLRIVGTPRHANVLIIAGPLDVGLRDAAAVAYAQMPRPRTILALGAGDIAPLPDADVSAPLTQAGLHSGLADLRRVVAAGAFRANTGEFTAAALEVRVEYTCPMHPEIVRDAPGDCPKCGMTLVPRETASDGHGGHGGHDMPREDRPNPADHAHAGHAHDAGGSGAYTCPMHPEVISDASGKCPKCGMNLAKAEEVESHGHGHGHGHASHAPSAHGDHAGHDDKAGGSGAYSCPMHPEVISDAPGKCPKCGMNLVKAEEVESHGPGHGHGHGGHGGHGKQQDHSGHDGHAGHGGHSKATIDGIEPHFMSMVELTEGQPRSSDGLQMDWIEVPFGPFFPGLPAGLRLTLTLDGDTVAASEVRSLVGRAELVDGPPMAVVDFVERLAAMMPLSPVAYRILACASIEEAARVDPGQNARRGRAAAGERERIVSHLGWLAEFGTQSGFLWLAARAGALQLAVRDADIDGIAAQALAIRRLIRRVEAAPLMRMRLGRIARIGKDTPASGPVDRARGGGSDARTGDPTLKDLGFEMRVRNGGDALARLRLRCDEIAQSLDLIAAAGMIAVPQVPDVDRVSGEGEARIETPRGTASLRVKLANGKVVEADLDTPTDVNIALVETVTAQQELGDALSAVASLDLSPWEVRG